MTCRSSIRSCLLVGLLAASACSSSNNGSSSSSTGTIGTLGTIGSMATSGSTGTAGTGSSATTTGTTGSTATTGTTATNGTTGGGPVAQFCNQLVSALATFEGRCEGASATYLQAYFAVGGVCAQIEAGVANGNITFNSSQAQACLAAIPNLACGADPTSCDSAIQGTVAANGTCYQSDDCSPGTFCNGGSGTATCPGTCVAEVAAGQPCPQEQTCVDGYTCVTGVCVPQPVLPSPGQACTEESGCQGSYCLLTTTDAGVNELAPDGGLLGVCATAFAEGASCTSSLGFCELGTYCSPATGTCTLVGMSGAACGAIVPNSDPVQCFPGFYCNNAGVDGGATGVCAPTLATGSPCSATVGDPAQCGNGTCVNGFCAAPTCLEP